MPQAASPDRLRAYRLRDVVKRKRRELTAEERRWLDAYDRKHPPRGPRRPSERGAPLSADDVPAPRLRPQTIPTSAQPSVGAEPLPPLDVAPEATQPGAAASAAPAPEGAPGTLPPLDVTAQPQPVAMPNHRLALMATAIVHGEIGEWAKRFDWGPKMIDELASGYLDLANIACHHYLPSTQPAPWMAATAMLGGLGAAVAGPGIRKQLDEAKLGEAKKANAIDAESKPRDQTPPPPPPKSREDFTGSGYE